MNFLEGSNVLGLGLELRNFLVVSLVVVVFYFVINKKAHKLSPLISQSFMFSFFLFVD
jgi:hypothetical protein